MTKKNRSGRSLLFISYAVMMLLFLSAINRPKTIVWKLDQLSSIGGHQPVIFGNPAVVKDGSRTAIAFDGVDDGLKLAVNPVEGLDKFTVEVLFKPAADGPLAPRFLHWEDKAGNRGTLELRLTRAGQWYLDAFLKNGITNKGITLIDSTHLHPAEKWYWAALVYDGKEMRSYINGEPDLQDKMDLPKMEAGEIAIGVRLNKVSWFKGLVSEIRFHPEALSAKQLRRK